MRRFSHLQKVPAHLHFNSYEPALGPIEERKATLAKLLRAGAGALLLNEAHHHPGDVVFRHACATGLEGIVSKRLGSRYVSGRTRNSLKFKNPAAPTVKREAEEDGGQ